ncbi:Galectin-3-binding protein A (Lectin galactoside-binding soluble 3-binding protein A), partial [Durusdinium trenchii]
MGELSLEGLSSTYTSLWRASGNQGWAWRDAHVVVPGSVSRLRFVAKTGSGWSSDIAIDDLSVKLGRYYNFRRDSVELRQCRQFNWMADVHCAWSEFGTGGENIVVLSGPCALTGSCVTSPNYPDNYGNSESCEILAPEKPLYFLRFATEEGDDVLTFNGQAYSGSSGPPQGTTTSDMILWSSDNVDSSTGWQMCTAHGVNHSEVNNKHFFRKRSTAVSLCLTSWCPPMLIVVLSFASVMIASGEDLRNYFHYSGVERNTSADPPFKDAECSCVTSPNYPDNYGNSESCEILAPEKPLYFLRFATEEGDDVLTFNGLAKPQLAADSRDSGVGLGNWGVATKKTLATAQVKWATSCELGVRYPHNPDLGDGPDEMGDHLLPVELGSGRTGQQVISGNDYSCALLDDDSVKCWGSNNCGRLGQGNVEHIGDGPNEMGDSLIPIDFGTILTSIISKSVRIVGTTRQGRVQVQYQQTWRDVCDDNWNILNAQVVCRQLGLAGGISLIHLNGSGEFGMDEVACEGNEFDLGYCPFRGWGIHDCSAQEAAGVKCHVDAWSTMPDPNIPARRGHSAIWNDDDDSMLVFAGHAAASFHFYNDLWRYKQDGRDGFWEEVQTVGPSPRGGHTAIWDRAGAMLVFGGSYLTTNFDELWIYSANTSSWSLASPPMKPKARAYHSGVWDAASQMMLIFAGENNGALQDLWQYQLASNNWTELSVFSFSEMPSARSRHTAVWIDAAKAMLVFGGWADTALNDLWHYALWSNSWTQLFTSSSPAGRAGHSAVWEPLTWSMLIF